MARAVRARLTPPSSFVPAPTAAARPEWLDRQQTPGRRRTLMVRKPLSRHGAGPLRDEPRLGQHGRQRQRRRAAHRGTLSELRRAHLAPRPRRTRARGRRAPSRTSSTSHGASGPKHPPSTTASTSNRFTADASPMPRCAARLGEARDHGRVAFARRDARAPRSRCARGAGRRHEMPARRAIASWPTNVSRQPTAPHWHGGPPGSTVMCPNSPPKPCAPRKSSPPMKIPRADADLGEDADEVVEAARDPCQCSASAARFASLSARTGTPPSRDGELVGDGDLRPAEVRRAQQRSRSPPRRGPGARRRCRRRRDPRPRSRLAPPRASRASRSSTGPGCAAPVVGVDALLVADVACKSSTQTAR